MTDASPDKGKGKATDESDAAPALEAPGADAAAPRAEVGIAAEATDKESSAAESSAKDTKESVTDDEEHDGDGDGEGDGEEDDDEEDESDEDEPRLKYTRLTPHLAAVYRNGDMTSSFMVAGDKMVRPDATAQLGGACPAHVWIGRR